MHNYKRLENESDEELIFRIASDKEIIGTWKNVADIINELTGNDFGESTYRKKYSIFLKMLNANKSKFISDDEYLKTVNEKLEDLRSERIKLQTANVERNRVDRSVTRQKSYYEYVGMVKETLPLPDFHPLYKSEIGEENEADCLIDYLCCISDIHYGATFSSENNSYSPKIVIDRLEYLSARLYEFINNKRLSHISIANIGDTIQGCLRLSDLRLNDSSVVKATIEISRIIAQFLNSLSAFVEITYYHVPSANHSQIRFLGSKAGELGDEDMEYLIANYIKDLCSNNQRITVVMADPNKIYLDINIPGYEVCSMHGHHVKNVENAIRDLSMVKRSIIDYLIVGHFHAGKELTAYEGCLHDCEVLVCPSFVGSDPYSDHLLRGSKGAVKIFGFDPVYGHTETYKIVLL